MELPDAVLVDSDVVCRTLLLEPAYCFIRPALALGCIVSIVGVGSDAGYIYCNDLDALPVDICRIVSAVEVAGQYILYRLTELSDVVSCCCVSDSDVAAVMLQLCLLQMVAVTGYCVGRYS